MVTPRKLAKDRAKRLRQKEQMENLARGAKEAAAQAPRGKKAHNPDDPHGLVQHASGDMHIRVISSKGVKPSSNIGSHAPRPNAASSNRPKSQINSTVRVVSGNRRGQATAVVRQRNDNLGARKVYGSAKVVSRHPTENAMQSHDPHPHTVAQEVAPPVPNAMPRPLPSSPPAQKADLTVLMTLFERPRYFRRQLDALRNQTMPPHNMVAWVNTGEVPHDEQALQGSHLVVFRTNTNMGPWIRFTMALEMMTKYVLVIDDDTIPGPRWIEACYKRLEQAEQAGEETFCIAAAGEIFHADDPQDRIFIGPERQGPDEIEVDVGRQAWFFRRDMAQLFMNYPRLGGPIGWGLHFAAALQQQGLYTVVLPYDRSNTEAWGMLEDPEEDRSVSQRIEFASQDGGPTLEGVRQEVYDRYRDSGWMPLCVLDNLEDEPEDEEASEAQAEAPSQA